MKLWSKIRIKDKNKDVELVAKALTNYLYGYGPILDVYRKYNIDIKDRSIIDNYTASRIAGLLMLYMTKDYKRINHIVNRYNIENPNYNNLIPEIETYIEK